MKNQILGLHHVTAISGEPQKTLDFYAGILGLRLVKKTVNFDDPGTYHLYFGNEEGSPGSIMTFFPWGLSGLKGRIGTGQVSTTSFSIPDGATAFWIEKLKTHNIEFDGPQSRFDEDVLMLRDPDGSQLELVASDKDDRLSWKNGPVPEKYAIRGFYHVALSVEESEGTAALVTETLGCSKLDELDNRFRYAVGEGGAGKLMDILRQPNEAPGRMGVGAVHHVAWRTSTEASQLELRQKLVDKGNHVTPVLDRNYFRSIYFREPGQILFEIATDPPGFTLDESKENLGRDLKLPTWLEQRREEIEKRLPVLLVPESQD